MSVLVCRDDEATIGVERVAGQIANRASSRLAQRDPCGEVEVVAKVAIRDATANVEEMTRGP